MSLLLTTVLVKGPESALLSVLFPFCFWGPPVAVQDTTFEMERRRNRPEKYDREVVQSTVEAMKRITEIRAKRQERFWEQRSVLYTTVHHCTSAQYTLLGTSVQYCTLLMSSYCSLIQDKPLLYRNVGVCDKAGGSLFCVLHGFVRLFSWARQGGGSLFCVLYGFVLCWSLGHGSMGAHCYVYWFCAFLVSCARQDEDQEGEGAEGGTDRAGEGHPSGEGAHRAGQGPFPDSAQEGGGEGGHGGGGARGESEGEGAGQGQGGTAGCAGNGRCHARVEDGSYTFKSCMLLKTLGRGKSERLARGGIGGYRRGTGREEKVWVGFKVLQWMNCVKKGYERTISRALLT